MCLPGTAQDMAYGLGGGPPSPGSAQPQPLQGTASPQGVGGWASGDHQRTGLWEQGKQAGAEPWKRALTADMSLVAKVSCSLLQIKPFKHSLSGLSAQGSSYTSRVTAMLILRDLQALGSNALSLSCASSSGRLLEEDSAPDEDHPPLLTAMLILRDLQALGSNTLSLSPASSFGRLTKGYSAPDVLPVTECPCLFPSLPTEELKAHLGWGYEVVLMTQKQEQKLLPLFLFYQAWSRVRFREDSELNTFKYSQLAKMQMGFSEESQGAPCVCQSPIVQRKISSRRKVCEATRTRKFLGLWTLPRELKL